MPIRIKTRKDLDIVTRIETILGEMKKHYLPHELLRMKFKNNGVIDQEYPLDIQYMFAREKNKAILYIGIDFPNTALQRFDEAKKDIKLNGFFGIDESTAGKTRYHGRVKSIHKIYMSQLKLEDSLEAGYGFLPLLARNETSEQELLKKILYGGIDEMCYLQNLQLFKKMKIIPGLGYISIDPRIYMPTEEFVLDKARYKPFTKIPILYPLDKECSIRL